jgi:hypothetical protein
VNNSSRIAAIAEGLSERGPIFLCSPGFFLIEDGFSLTSFTISCPLSAAVRAAPRRANSSVERKRCALFAACGREGCARGGIDFAS